MGHGQEMTGLEQIEIAEIFRRYGAQVRAQNGITKEQFKVMSSICECRTADCGFHIDRCGNCDHQDSQYNSCRNRHCPKCQSISRRKWVNDRLEKLLPVSYYHAVFTLPRVFELIIRYNKRTIYNLLLSSSSDTLLSFGKDPKWLGGEIGFFGILHTWGQTLWAHPHVHYIVPGGALSAGDEWIEPKYSSKFLFPVRALSKVFRGKFIEGLKAKYYSGDIVLPPELSDLKRPDLFEIWIDAAVSTDWVVYCKPPFGDAEQVVRYIGRYTHRVAISNSRVVGVKKHRVYFRYKQYSQSRIKWDVMSLSCQEFIRRFLFHVLPKGFHKIRHYGYLANGRASRMVAKIRNLLNSVPESIKEVTGDDLAMLCPKCGRGYLLPVWIVNRWGEVVTSDILSFKSGYAFDTS